MIAQANIKSVVKFRFNLEAGTTLLAGSESGALVVLPEICGATSWGAVETTGSDVNRG